MNKTVYVVQTRPAEGREEEFNDWYTNQHLADVLEVPGFISAQRFKISDAHPRSGDQPAYPFEYLALYDIEGDAGEALAAMGRAVDEGMFLSEAMAEFQAFIFTSITDLVTRSTERVGLLQG